MLLLNEKKGGHNEHSWIVPACRELPTRPWCSASVLFWFRDRRGVLPWNIACLSCDMS